MCNPENFKNTRKISQPVCIKTASVRFPLQLDHGVAAVQSDATLVILVACHPDVALISKLFSPAGCDENKNTCK